MERSKSAEGFVSFLKDIDTYRLAAAAIGGLGGLSVTTDRID